MKKNQQMQNIRRKSEKDPRQHKNKHKIHVKYRNEGFSTKTYIEFADKW